MLDYDYGEEEEETNVASSNATGAPSDSISRLFILRYISFKYHIAMLLPVICLKHNEIGYDWYFCCWFQRIRHRFQLDWWLCSHRIKIFELWMKYFYKLRELCCFSSVLWWSMYLCTSILLHLSVHLSEETVAFVL